MPREPQSYLRSCLAEGAQPFRYRSRIRSLLGLAHSGGVEINFSKPLPVPGFSYVAPRFAGETEFPDELFSESPRRMTHAEETAPPISRTDVKPRERERVVPVGGRAPSSFHKEALSGMEVATPPEPNTPLSMPSAAIPALKPTAPQARPEPNEKPPRAESISPAVKLHEEIVPDARRDPPAISAVRNAEQAGQFSQTSPSPFTPPLSKPAALSTQADAPKPGAPMEAGKPAIVPPDLARATTPRIVEASAVDPQLQVRHPRMPSLRAQSAEGAEAPVAKSLPRNRAPHAATPTQDFPSVRRPEQAVVSSPEPDSSPSRAPATPLEQPQVTYVNQSSEPGTPIAFWERRYLNHLRVRVRR